MTQHLNDILEKLHEKVLIGWIINDGKPHKSMSHGTDDGCTDDARKAIVEAVEGLVGPHKPGQREVNQFIDQKRKAIKEWQ